MPLMNEAMPKEEWERMQRGEKTNRPKPIPRTEPTFPKVKDLIKFEDIPLTEFDKVMNAKMRRIRNEEGVNFIGYDVTILLKGKRGAGRPKEDESEPSPRTLTGWMIEGDYEKLRRQR